MRFLIIFITIVFAYSCSNSVSEKNEMNIDSEITKTKEKINYYLFQKYQEKDRYYLHKFVCNYFITFDSLVEIGINKKDFDSIQKDLNIIVAKNSFQLDSLFFEKVSFEDFQNNTEFSLYKIYRNYLTLLSSVHCNGNNTYALKYINGKSFILNNKRSFNIHDTIEMYNFYQVTDSNFIYSNFINKIIRDNDTIYEGGPNDVCPFAKYEKKGEHSTIKLYGLKKGIYKVYIEICRVDAYNAYYWTEKIHSIIVN